ncbi:MAG TPA: His-Xaa-Ser system radical SAM maturase HxsC [Kofleriaceae bacterium]
MTLVQLSGRALVPLGAVSAQPFLGRVSERRDAPGPDEILLGDTSAPGFRAYFYRDGGDGSAVDSYRLGAAFHYLSDGDVVRVDPQRGAIHTLYRRQSPSNALLVTERCDNYCVMCSQPPKERDDGWLVDELERAIPLMSPETRELGITGGEPTLLGARLPRLLAVLRDRLPRTAVHMLSNGRNFSRPEVAAAVAAVAHPDLMIGIPLYGDAAPQHDYIVQARGAFDETVRGILELKRRGVRVELRFVIHRETADVLPDFARFVARNLVFADHVALMGLELMGFARSNLEALWIDPLDYGPQLHEATVTLARAGVAVSIYNHQLCVLPPALHRFARAAISDWKNQYHAECQSCTMQNSCGGFFASARIRRSRGIGPIGPLYRGPI